MAGTPPGGSTADLSPKSGVRPRKKRLAMRRAKSAAEPLPVGEPDREGSGSDTQTDSQKQDVILRGRPRYMSLPERGPARDSDIVVNSGNFYPEVKFVNPRLEKLKNEEGVIPPTTKKSSEFGDAHSELGAVGGCPDETALSPKLEIKSDEEADTGEYKQRTRPHRSRSLNRVRRRHSNRLQTSHDQETGERSLESSPREMVRSSPEGISFRGSSNPSSRSNTPSSFYTPESSRKSSISCSSDYSTSPAFTSTGDASPATLPKPRSIDIPLNKNERTDSNQTLTEQNVNALNGNGKNKILPFFKVTGFLSGNHGSQDSSKSQSQQSSMVGLDWLFPTDSSESGTSGKFTLLPC